MTKKDWATFWASFSQAHLATLLTANNGLIEEPCNVDVHGRNERTWAALRWDIAQHLGGVGVTLLGDASNNQKPFIRALKTDTIELAVN
jgi:hypothetical protein